MDERENVLRFCSEQRAEMERIWRRLGRYESNGNAYGAWVQARHAPKGWDTWKPGEPWQHGERLAKPKWVRCELPVFMRALRPNSRNTDIFGRVLREFAQATLANGVVIMSEMWFKVYEDAGGDPYKARRCRAEDPESLEHAPGREEGLMLSLEHVHVGRRMWIADIKRQPTRLEPWRMCSMDGAPLDTNLAGIVDVSA